MNFPPASSLPGVLHYVPPNLAVFEPSKALVRSLNINTLLWIGGLQDTFLSVAYPPLLAQALPPTWSVAMASLGSAGNSWGVGSIAQDAEEIAKIIAYLKQNRPGGKVVIMGHSTGCQDCMEYLTGSKAAEYPPVEGVILQAPVSDREALEFHLPQEVMAEANQLALLMCHEGKGSECMPTRITKPLFGKTAITAKRWVDIASPPPDRSGADDFFSSDTEITRLQKTFGKIAHSAALLILFSGSEGNVSPSLDKETLVGKWTNVVHAAGGKVDEQYGGVVPGATHNLNGDPDAVVQDLLRRVAGYIGRLDAGDFTTAAARI